MKSLRVVLPHRLLLMREASLLLDHGAVLRTAANIAAAGIEPAFLWL